LKLPEIASKLLKKITFSQHLREFTSAQTFALVKDVTGHPSFHILVNT